jgi:hypothetical protein
MTGAVAGFAVLVAALVSSGCESSAPAPAAKVPTPVADVPSPSGSLPDVAVTLAPATRASAELTGHAWYVTAVKDPARGNYTAAVERRSLGALSFDAPYEGEQRASLVLVLRDGRAADLMLSIERGKFVCEGPNHDNVCALHVSIDDTALRPVRFAVPRHSPPTQLHLVGGDDARQLLAAIAKAKQLRIQPIFEQEGSPEIEFALAGLNRAIAKVMKRSVAATPKLATVSPGA